MGRRAKSCPPVSCSGVGPPGTAGCPGRGGPGTRRVRSNQTRDRRPRPPCPTTRFRPRGRRRRPRGRAGRRGRGRGQGARRAAGSWANPNAGDTGRRPGGGAAGPRPAPGRRGGGWGRPRQGGRLCNGARAPLARAAPGDGGRKACEMIGRLPEAGFGPGGGAGARGGGQTIATGRSRPAKGRARAGGPAQTVADIIETEGGRELGKAQADDVTPRWERAGGVPPRPWRGPVAPPDDGA